MISQALIDEKYMQRCLELALMGAGNVSPNPMVGSVVVFQDRIIGEGYHIKYGEPHAEVNAINSVKDKSLLPESTLYVNLEPCSHFGKTPPCADYIVTHKIKRVVIGTVDCNAKVCGKGIQKLQNAGVEVVVGVLENDCTELNKRFFYFQQNKKPYVVLKWAESFDGFIDRKRDWKTERPEWFTNKISDAVAHKIRVIEDGIMVGKNTVLADNPQLNVREWSGKNPTRIVVDKDLSLSGDFHIFNPPQKTIIFNQIKSEVIGNVEYIKIDFNEDTVETILYKLAEHKIASLMVEGGSILLNSFITKKMWNEAFIFKSPKTLTEGVAAPEIKGVLKFETNLNGIRLVNLKNSEI